MPEAAVKLHLSLNVADLDRAVSFYRVLFGIEPAKQFTDYAKFELTDPPLVLSLAPQPHGAGGALNHLGFRLPDAGALVEMQRRLESAGITTSREDGVECCHARQTKFWVLDPDRNNWEMYVLEEDIEDHPPGCAPAAANEPKQIPETAWQHDLGTPFSESIPMANGSVDRVLLRGTFNVPLSPEDQARVLRECRRVLRAGGSLQVHGLVADRSLSGDPLALPGPAAVVRHVPVHSELIGAIEAAGFVGIRLVKFSPSPVFELTGVALRELLLEATKLDASPFDLRQVVLYKGPFRQVTDDAGNVYPRGKRVAVSGGSVELLRSGSLADSFIFFLPGSSEA